MNIVRFIKFNIRLKPRWELRPEKKSNYDDNSFFSFDRIISTGLSLLLFFLLWRYAAISFKSSLLPSPTEVYLASYQMLAKGILFDALLSISRVMSGLAISFGCSLIAAFMLFTFRPANFLIKPTLDFLSVIPPISLIPFAILWFGLGTGSAVFLVAYTSFFPIFSSIYDGLSRVERTTIDAARSLGASKKDIVISILLPATLPNLLTGLKIAVSLSWFVVITAELVGSQSGLGYLIQANRLTISMDRVVVCMITIGIIGLISSALLSIVEQRLTEWNKA